MKIPVITLLLVFTSLCLSAQVERKPAKIKSDSTASALTTGSEISKDRKEKLKELDLTREQKLKLRELRQANQAKKEAIENNTALTDQQKKSQLRALQKEQTEKLMNILTEEQKARYRAGNSNNP